MQEISQLFPWTLNQNQILYFNTPVKLLSLHFFDNWKNKYKIVFKKDLFKVKIINLKFPYPGRGHQAVKKVTS
jgi:hypothetical protein